MTMITLEIEIQAVSRRCSAVVANHEIRAKKTKANEIGMLLTKNSKEREFRICGIRLDVTTINSDFRRDFKRWLSPT